MCLASSLVAIDNANCSKIGRPFFSKRKKIDKSSGASSSVPEAEILTSFLASGAGFLGAGLGADFVSLAGFDALLELAAAGASA